MKQKFNTVTVKASAVIFFIGMSILLCFYVILPKISYMFLKEDVTKYTQIILKNQLTDSFKIFRVYTGAHEIFFKDEKLSAAVLDLNDDNREYIRHEIEDYFTEPEAVGGDQRYWFEWNYSKFNTIALLTEDGEVVGTDESTVYADIVLGSEEYRDYLLNEYTQEYLPSFTAEYNGETRQMICYAYQFELEGKQFISLLFIDEQDFETLLEPLIEINVNDFAVFGHENKFVYSHLPREESHIDIILYPDEMLEGQQNEMFVYESDKGIDFLTRITFPSENLTLIVHNSNEQSMGAYQQIFILFQIVMVISFVLFIIIVCIVLKKSLSNLKLLSNTIEEAKLGDYHTAVSIKSKDEIGKLADNFNIMMAKIDNNIKEIVEYEQKQQELQYIIMVSEIDPHFIYNTLNTVSYLAEFGNKEDVIKVNNALIATLKDRIKIKKQKSFDTVHNEKAVIENYMLIQNYLVHNKLVLQFDIEEELEEVLIPKNILQPLVENSIKHGILLHRDENDELMDGEIKISIHKENDFIKLMVEDNGIGMSREKIEQYFYGEKEYEEEAYEDKANHIGVQNVRMRLAYLYDNRCTIDVYSEIGEGTTIVIILPKSPSEGRSGQ